MMNTPKASASAATPAITLFETRGTDGLERGADGLLYVMAHGHALTVPTDVLLFAEKIGVISIARRDTAEPVLRDVNKALNTIAASLRLRAQLDREEKDGGPGRRDDLPNDRPDDDDDGYKVRLVPRVPQLPPSGATAVPLRLLVDAIEPAAMKF